MATPMILPGTCPLCWGPHGGGTFTLDDDGETVALVLTDVCVACRMNEIRELIRRAPSRTRA